jgi:hypothetical protein
VAPEDWRAPLSWASGLSLDYDELFFTEEIGVGGTKVRRFDTEFSAYLVLIVICWADHFSFRNFLTHFGQQAHPIALSYVFS